nr:FG-GAP repeat protein [Pseudomarimonas arenosa]
MGSDVVAAGDTVVFSPFVDVRSDDNFFAFERVGGSWQRSGQFQQRSQVFSGGGSQGTSLSSDGRLLVVHHPFVDVGVELSAGAVNVYERGGAGWVELAALQAPTPTAGARYGGGSDIEGDWLIVGAPGEPVASNTTDPGRAFVYERVGNNYVFRQELIPPDGVAQDRFGYLVDFSGNQVLINARSHLNPNNSRGAVYVYELSGGTWQYVQTLATGSRNLTSVDGDLLVARSGTGGTQLFSRSAGTWAAAGPGPSIADFLWELVIKDGAVPRMAGLIVPGAEDEVYLSEFRGGAWSTPAKVNLPVAPGPFAGTTLALTETHLFAGDPYRSFNRVVEQGVGYAFALGTGSPVLERTFVHGNGLLGDLLGGLVAIDGDWALAASRGRDQLGATDAGAVYMYKRGVSDWELMQSLSPPSAAQSFDVFGTGAAMAGDLAVVASQAEVAGVLNIGRADVYRRTGDQWNWVCELPPPFERGAANSGFSNLFTNGEHVVALFNNGWYSWRVVADDCVSTGGLSPTGQPASLSVNAITTPGRLLIRQTISGVTDWHVMDFDGSQWVRTNGFAYSGQCQFEVYAAFKTPQQLAVGCLFPTLAPGATTAPLARLMEETAGVWSQTAVIEADSPGKQPLGISWGSDLVISVGEGNQFVEVQVQFEPAYTQTQRLLVGDAECSGSFYTRTAANAQRIVTGCSEANTAAGRRSGKLYFFERGPTVAKGTPLFNAPQEVIPPPTIKIVLDSFESP